MLPVVCAVSGFIELPKTAHVLTGHVNTVSMSCAGVHDFPAMNAILCGPTAIYTVAQLQKIVQNLLFTLVKKRSHIAEGNFYH